MPPKHANDAPTPERLAYFRAKVLAEGERHYRDLPWRRTRDPYAIWISEVMLQQTQVVRVDGRWQRWLARFPSVESLAQAAPADVLEEWQGMGYNRRALALHRAACAICEQGGELPREADALTALPGIGPATAAGIRAFAWDLPAIYLETNVRTVFLHELFPDEADVTDARIRPLVEVTCPPGLATSPDAPAPAPDALAPAPDAPGPADVPDAPAPAPDAPAPASAEVGPRTWYYALLDYGAHLKATLPNPSRRSHTHVRQTPFEGSHRQKRAALVRLLLAHRATGAPAEALIEALSSSEEKAGRMSVSADEVAALLAELQGEGFCREERGLWHI